MRTAFFIVGCCIAGAIASVPFGWPGFAVVVIAGLIADLALPPDA